MERERIYRTLEEYLLYEASRKEGWVPIQLEFFFGSKDRADFLTLEMDGGEEILLRGKIDRVDWSPARQLIRVVDYKTGKLPSRLESLDGGRQLQIHIYLLAACECLGLEKASGILGVYQSVEPGGNFKCSSIHVVDLGGLKEKLQNVIEELLWLRNSGCLPPAKGCDACSWCDYSWACNQYPVSIWRRKALDPDFQRFMRIVEIG